MKAVADTSPAHAGPVTAAQAATRVSLRRVNIARARWQIYPAAASLPPMELSRKCAIGRGAGLRTQDGPKALVLVASARHERALARYLSTTVAKRAHRAATVSPGMNLQDSSRDTSVGGDAARGGESR